MTDCIWGRCADGRLTILTVFKTGMVGTVGGYSPGGYSYSYLQHPCKDDEPAGRNLCEALGTTALGLEVRDSRDVKAFEASYILSYNVVQDHEGDIHQGISRFQTARGPHLLRPF